MNEVRKHPVVYIKAAIFSILLLGESYALTYAISYFVDSQNFFKFDQTFTFFTIIFLYLILITNAILVGAWNTWEQYVVGPLPISLGIFIAILPTNSSYAVITAFFIFLLLCYDALLASNLKEQLIKFNPHLILKFASRGILFSFSLIPAVLIIIANPDQRTLNIGRTVGNISQSFVNKYVVPKVNTQIQNQMGTPDLSKLGVDKFDSIKTLDVVPKIDTEKIIAENFSVKDTVEKEVNNVVTPYRHLINPILAITLFWMIQFFGFFSKILFNATITIVYGIAKRVGLFHITTEVVEKEIIHF